MESVVSLINIGTSADRFLSALEPFLALTYPLVPPLIIFAEYERAPRTSWNKHLLATHWPGSPLLIQYVEFTLIDTFAGEIRVQSIPCWTLLSAKSNGLTLASFTAELIVDTLAQSIGAEALSPLASFEILR